MDFDVGTNARGGGTSPVHDGQNDPLAGPQQVTQGGAQMLRHPILNGKWLITRFLVFSFLMESFLGMPLMAVCGPQEREQPQT
jgi:hypothetical protein